LFSACDRYCDSFVNVLLLAENDCRRTTLDDQTKYSDILFGRRCRHVENRQQKQSEERNTMSRFVTILSAGIMATAIIAGSALLPAPAAAAMSDADAAAMKKATVDCKAEVGEKAKYHEMSWLARHKMVKNCVKETLAKGH
jgi:hypothetical protein